MEKLKVTRDPTYKTYWNVRGEDGGLRAVLYNPAPRRWFISGSAPFWFDRIAMPSKDACVAYLHGFAAGFDRAIEVRDREDAQQGFPLEGT